MEAQAQSAPTDNTSSLRLIGTLVLIAMLSGFMVVLAYQVTQPYILANRLAALEKAVFAVLPGAVSRESFLLDENGLQKVAATEVSTANVFAGYDKDGNLVGVALDGAARGYQDVVKVLYGYSLKDQCVVGMTVLQSTETPGLGDRVQSDPGFLANFECLKAEVTSEGTSLQNEITTVKHGKKVHPWEIDGISGATVTSKAVGAAIQKSTNKFVPLVMRHREELMQPKEIE